MTKACFQDQRYLSSFIITPCRDVNPDLVINASADIPRPPSLLLRLSHSLRDRCSTIPPFHCAVTTISMANKSVITFPSLHRQMTGFAYAGGEFCVALIAPLVYLTTVGWI